MEKLYEKKRSYTVHGYIALGKSMQDKTRRNMNADDLKMFRDMMAIRKDYNLIAFETLALIAIMKKIGNPKLYPIIINMGRVCNSALKQRDLCYAVSETFVRVEPMIYEVGYINRMQKQMLDRISFVRSYIIPENVLLTPIQDYLEAVGAKCFEDAVVGYYGNRHEVYRATHDDAEVEEFILNLYETVNAAGKGDAYRERLDKYFERNEKLRESAEIEKKEKRMRSDRAIADDGMYEYRKLFWKTVRAMETCAKIGVSRQAMEKMISKHSRNMFVVVRCHAFHDRPIYRYLKPDGSWGLTMASAEVFKSEAEANGKVVQFSDQHPEHAYDVISPKWA